MQIYFEICAGYILSIYKVRRIRDWLVFDSMESRTDSLSILSRQSDLAIYDVPKKEQAVRGINGQELR